MASSIINASQPKVDVNRYLSNSVHDLLSLKGRTVVITGGARGLGLAFALAVAEVRGNIAILDAAQEPHDHFYRIEKEHEIKIKYYRSDVTNYETLKETFSSIVKDFGRIDGLPESVAKCMNINVLGTYYAAQLAAVQMASQEPTDFNPRGGSIVMIASIAAYMATDMTLDLCNRYPHLGEIMNTEPPMRRMGDRTDLKVPVVYLLSNASAYHTSDDILITGGIHAGRLM
ncbi:short-chain dehydrogenase reductase sdr [Colletotrichum kahawae]|uniref:Short-chain dehydrogenase reductase sdr n=1 Tax=Colletotrichum kahawae TaxID=34407 RepID=A0AAE0D0B8_COLKA|nr:short-chain dehydrogenase reductase sdr [Colletotrichum kahawae]